jgi:hypothetical protein
MRDSIIEQIERRARLYHGGDVNKAAAEYFRDYPEKWQHYRAEVHGVNERAADDRERINAAVDYQIVMIAHRDKLDLNKAADRVAAQAKVFSEDPELYKRYRAGNIVRVG